MKSKQIQKELETLEAQRDNINKEIIRKRAEFFNALNKESSFKYGDIVTIFRGEKKVGTGIFVKIAPSKYSWNSQTEYVIAKMKNDGSQSKNMWHQFDFDRIEKL